MYFQATTTIPPSTAKTKCEDDRSSFHFDLINRQETPIHATPFGLALLIPSVGAQPLQRLHDNKRWSLDNWSSVCVEKFTALVIFVKHSDWNRSCLMLMINKLALETCSSNEYRRYSLDKCQYLISVGGGDQITKHRQLTTAKKKKWVKQLLVIPPIDLL